MDSRLLVPATNLWFNSHFFALSVIQLLEYQLYAVEKWIVERDRPVNLLSVYTGDHNHKITLTVLSPISKQHWDDALQILRRDGAKPKLTPHGILMVTSLAHFRSDYTIVKIPDGNFTHVCDHLYANINLLRMGCSGRSALALDDPSDTTKDRFMSAYHIPDSTIPTSHLSPPPSHNSRKSSAKNLPLVRGKTKDRAAFTITVLELVKLVQAALAIFGMYGCSSSTSIPINLVLDGLLCDKTVDGIRKWISEIGEPCVGLEPTERIADPMFVAAILSLVISIRNKLATLGYSHILPKDPFIYPHAFSLAVMAFLQSSALPPISIHHQTTPFIRPHHAPSASTGHLPLTTSSPYSLSQILSRELVESIESAYERSRLGDNKRVRRVLKGKLEDRGSSNKAAGNGSGYNHGVDSEGDDRGGEQDKEREPISRDRRSTLSGNEAERGTLSSLAVVVPTTTNPGIGSSGNRVLGNIGSLLSGSGPPGGAGSVMEATTGLVAFLSVVLSKEREGMNGRRKERNVRKSRERKERKEKAASVDLTMGGAAFVVVGREKEGVVAASVKALWSGRINDLVRMREWEGASCSTGGREGGRRMHRGVGNNLSISSTNEKWQSLSSTGKRSALGIHSDNDIEPRSDGGGGGRSTEADEDSEGVYATAASTATGTGGGAASPPTTGIHPGTFGSSFSGRVRGKLGSWAGLAGGKKNSKGQQQLGYGSGSGSGHGHRYAPGSLDLTPPSLSLSSSGQGGHDVVRSVSGGAGSMGSGSVGAELIGRARVMVREGGSNIITPPRLVISPTPSSSLSRNKRMGMGISRGSQSSGPQSPTLPPLVFAGDKEGFGDDDDDDMLSSGQVSPLSDHRPNPFNVLHSAPSVGSSTSNLNANNALLSPNLPFSFSRKLKIHSASSIGNIGSHTGSATTGGGIASAGLPVLPRRPWVTRRLSTTPRVSSWADPISAKHILDEEWEGGEEGEDGMGLLEGEEGGEDDALSMKLDQGHAQGSGMEYGEDSDVSEVRSRRGWRAALLPSFEEKDREREKARFSSMLSVVDGDGVRSFIEEPTELQLEVEDGEIYDELWRRRRRVPVWSVNPMRRRSFHDLDSFQDMPVLTPERMRIDVEICGQVLVMIRREEHLKNVISCIQILNSNLSDTNTLLRQEYETNLANLSLVESRTRVLAEIDDQNILADKLSQATNTLRYEAEQFHLPDLWHAASLSRQKVFNIRDKVFGTIGGRRLPSGMHGAHGRFNRLQKFLDGEERLVDYLGRTESEVEEEERVDPERRFLEEEEEEGDGESAEEDVVEHPGIRPVWLLRFFMGWGARWSAVAPVVAAGSNQTAGKKQDAEGDADAEDKPVCAVVSEGGEKTTNGRVSEDKKVMVNLNLGKVVEMDSGRSSALSLS